MNSFEKSKDWNGLWTRNLQPVEDSRGKFVEQFREDLVVQEAPEFTQDSLSYSTKGVVRGMHGQKKQWQIITLVYGEILDVLMDVDVKSNTYSQIKTFELSEKNPLQILIAPTILHGFQVKSKYAIISYKASHHYDPANEFGLNVASECFSDIFNLKTAIISKKDFSLPMFWK